MAIPSSSVTLNAHVTLPSVCEDVFSLDPTLRLNCLIPLIVDGVFVVRRRLGRGRLCSIIWEKYVTSHVCVNFLVTFLLFINIKGD